VLADIFLGNITKWNDPRIVALNPTLTLPAKVRCWL
jgi:phosphate transport system substrate-binding protein